MSNKHPNYLPASLVIGFFLLSIAIVWDSSFSGNKVYPGNLEDSVRELSLAVNMLNTKVESLSDSMQDMPGSPASIVERSPKLEPTLRDLVERLDSLETTLGLLDNSSNGFQNAPALGSQFSVANLVERYPMNEPALLLLKNNSRVDNSIGFLGMSYHQVLSRFGSPNHTSLASGRVTFYYQDLSGGGKVVIAFQNERVVSLNADW
jgi:hypothetical protein